MPKRNFNKLLSTLKKDFPELHFESGDSFRYSPPSNIYYLKTPRADLLILHEIGHYLLNRNDYESDIELINIESSAWEKAKELCVRYSVEWDEDFIQDRLDTYRDYLHQRSNCKNCNLNGYQDKSNIYHCPLCGKTWK